MPYDSRLVRDVLHIFVQALFSSLRRRARHCWGIRKAKCGALTFVQRFGGAINLNVHLRSLVLDGVYYVHAQQKVRFQRLPAPADSEVARVTADIARRVMGLLERRGLGPRADPEEADPLIRNQPLLAELCIEKDALGGSHQCSVDGLETKERLTKTEFDSTRGDLNRVEPIYRVQRFVQLAVSAEAGQFVIDARLVEAKDGTVVALDPDIPADEQRLFFEARPASDDNHWILNGQEIGPSGSLRLWKPRKGAYTLSLIDSANCVLDTVSFQVRGNLPDKP